jgi:type I restriction enzyme S subunit
MSKENVKPPGSWSVKPLSEIADVIVSNVDKKSVPGEQPVRLCNYIDVYNNENITPDLSFMEATASKSEIAKFRLRSGDVIITKDSETPNDIGVPSIVRADVDQLICGYHLSIIRLKSQDNDPVFLARQLNSPRIASYFGRQANGTTRYGLGIDSVGDTEIWLAPSDEQRRIALILDTVDAAIAKTEALIEKLKQIKSGLLYDLLTRGVDENGELRNTANSHEFVSSNKHGMLPKTWSVCRLDSVADVQRGKFTHRPRNDPDYYGGEFPFIQTGDVAAAGGERIYSYSQTLSLLGTTVSRVFPIETVAITIAANIADTAILGIPMYFPDSVVAAVVKTPNVPRYIELCIRKSKRTLSALAPQSAQKNINLTDLRPLPILLPRPDEQGRIAAKYESIQKQIVSETGIAQKYKSLKAGLLNDLLCGRKPTRQFVGVPT